MNYDAKQRECETREYKKFMKVAKRISYLQYGKWTIAPDLNDPLRKFTLEKDAGWFTIKVGLYMEQFYHRNVYDDNRYDYRAKIQVGGMLGAKRHSTNGFVFVDLPVSLGMKLKPRMAKKLITAIDEVIIPKIYAEIQNESETRVLRAAVNKQFTDNLAKVPNLMLVKNPNNWDSTVRGIVKDSPFTFSLSKDYVEAEGRMTYDQLGKMVEAMGWGK